MVRRIRLLLLFALCATAGCSGCRKPPGAGDDTPQGQRLKELFDNGVAMPVEIEGETPFRFEPIRIDRHEKDGKGFYQARLGWEYTRKDRPLDDYLKDRIQRNTHELLTTFGRISAFRLHLSYGVGDPEDVDVRPDGNSGVVTLEKFCATDKPRAIKVSLHAATWFEDEILSPCFALRPGEGKIADRKLILIAPAELPIRFEDCPLDTGARVSWRLVGEPALLAQRAAFMTERNPRIVGREVKSLRLALSYRDSFGRPLWENEDVVLDLTERQGTITLPNLRRGDALGSVALYAVSVTWKERATAVMLTK